MAASVAFSPAAGLRPKLFVAVAVALVALVYPAWCAWLGASQDLWIVNGAARGYVVEVDGARVAVSPGDSVRLDDVGAGLHHARVTVNGRAPLELDIDLRTRFLLRPYEPRVFVLNPDRAAVLVVESMVYVDTTRPPRSEQPTPPPTVRTGEVLHRMKADFVFRDFPEEVSLRKGERSTKRTRLIVADGGLAGAQEALADRGTHAQLAQLKARLAFDSTDEEAVLAWAELSSDDAALVAAVTPMLDHRPTLVEHWFAWMSAEPDIDVTAARARLLHEPDACARYVLAHLPMGARSRRADLARSAAEGCPYAQVEQAQRLFIDGDVAAARAMILATAPGGSVDLQQRRRAMLYAAGEANAWLAEPKLDDSDGLAEAIDRIHAAGLAGDRARVTAVRTKFLQREVAALADALAPLADDDDERAELTSIYRDRRVLVRFHAAYWLADVEALEALLDEGDSDAESNFDSDGDIAFELDMIHDQVDADDWRDDVADGDIDPSYGLYAAAAAARAGDTVRADTLLRAAQMGYAASDAHALASLLATVSAATLGHGRLPTLAAVRDAADDVPQATAVFTFLAERFPRRPDYRTEALRLATDAHLPSLFLRARR